MSSNSILKIISVLATAIGTSYSGIADTFNFASAPVTGKEQGVLVLAPGMNMDGKFFLEETPWMEFAERNGLGVVALNYSSDPGKLYGPERQGYYWPEQGSGKALLGEIKRLYKKDLPVLIYGFSGGAQFAGRFIDFAPGRIIAWCAYSAQFWDSPKSLEDGGCKARGIVACGDLDGARWQPSFGFYYQGRLQGKDWIWLSRRNTEHNRSAGLEKFVREFFQEELDIHFKKKEAKGDVFADVSKIEIVEDKDFEMQPALLSTFRTKELFESWKGIHSP